MPSPLRMIVVADMRVGRVKTAWDEFDQFLKGQPQLNEVIISSGASLRMIDVELAIDGEAVTTYSGDGVIVSTPVGSTAHSLSAGGPILRQDLQCFVITPICPHALTNRPLVDSSECTFTLTAPDAPAGTMLVIDGQIK